VEVSSRSSVEDGGSSGILALRLEKAGREALFVGTGGVVGAYTGLSAEKATQPQNVVESLANLVGSQVSG
jgi:hypothetical protein